MTEDNRIELDKDTIERELTKALKMVVMAIRDLGFNDEHILGKTNLILQDFIDDNGEFTEEYVALARQAIELRRRPEDNKGIITTW